MTACAWCGAVIRLGIVTPGVPHGLLAAPAEEVELFALDDAGNIFRKNWGGKGGSGWAKLPTVPTGG